MIINSVRPVPLICVKRHINLPRRQRAHQDKEKTDKPGIDIYIDGKTDGEAVYIPVVLSKSGMTDLVYNDFYVEDGADVRIVAGCGIHNSGCNESRHDGIHTFHVGKMRMSDMRKSITARETEQVRECSTL